MFRCLSLGVDIVQVDTEAMFDQFVLGVSGGFVVIFGVYDTGFVHVSDLSVVVGVVIELVAGPAGLVHLLGVEGR